MKNRMYNFKGFTSKANDAINIAIEEAGKMGHTYIGTEHLLLGLILEDTGVINSVLGFFGIEPVKMINTQGAVILGMVYNYLPYMVLPLYSSMTKIDRSLVEAAKDLGCNGMHIMTKVIFPLSVSGIISGITMVFVPSISTFYISQKLGGGNFDLVGDTIERQFQIAYNYNLGAAMSLVLMVLIIICMAVMNKFGNDKDEVIV